MCVFFDVTCGRNWHETQETRYHVNHENRKLHELFWMSKERNLLRFIHSGAFPLEQKAKKSTHTNCQSVRR